MQQEWINALIGGGLIGISVSLMLLWNGRVTGISGIINGLFSFKKGDTTWRTLFIAGLFAGGLTLKILKPESLSSSWTAELEILITAGLLVGFGTVMGSGCTSGHGVCGISRLSPRSLSATLAFMAAGIVAVLVLKRLGVL